MTRKPAPVPFLTRPRILIFDVNETMLDLLPLKQRVNDLLGSQDGATLWFSSMLHHSLVMTVSEEHADLTEIGIATLQMVAQGRGIEVGADEAAEVLSAMRELPAYPDVIPALERLRTAGYRLAALSNSPVDGLAAQLANAGLTEHFECQLSVDPTRRFKPHRTVYLWASETLEVAAADCMLVAAHGWDVAGAKWAGMRSAFVERPGQHRFPLDEPPDLVASDFARLADALIAMPHDLQSLNGRAPAAEPFG